MVRASILSVSAALVTAAAAPAPVPFPKPVIAQVMAAGPVTTPRFTQTSRYDPAPVPDQDYVVPGRSSGPAKAEFAPNLFQPRKNYRGEGYVPGSTVQGGQERRIHPAPGFSLKVPLE